jgi:hypothetical protein
MRALAALLITCASPALAQNSGGPPETLRTSVNAQAEVGEEDILGAPAQVGREIGPGTTDAILALTDAIEVNASEDGTNASIRVGTTLSRRGGAFHTLTLTAGAPVDKAEGSAFSAFDPFANSVFIEGRYTFSQLLGRVKNASAVYQFCESIAPQSAATLETVGCSDEYVRANAPDRFVEFQRLTYRNPKVIFAGLSGRVGHDRYEFLEAATGNKLDETRTPWSVGGFLGISFLDWRNSFAVEYRHEKSFKAAPTAAVCPASATGVVICLIGPVGQPKEQEQDIVTGEFRQRLGRNFAFSIKVSYELESEIFKLDVPLYFIDDDKLGLNAGVRGRYIEDPDADDLNEGLFFGIFVSKSFSLFR